MPETKDTGLNRVMEMWMEIPFEMYKTGQQTAKAYQSKTSQPGDSAEPGLGFDDVANQARQLWLNTMGEGMKWFEKHKDNAKESVSSPGAYARDMGVFSMEAFNELFEKALKNTMFKRVGPARNFQGKIDQAMEKTGEFNIAAMEFFRYLSLPMESATRNMLHEISKQGNGALTPDAMKQIYTRWLSHMEEQYGKLYKTPSYLNSLDFFVRAAGESRAAMLSINNDLYKQMGIASLEEMDDISFEIYQLKKKVSQLEKMKSDIPVKE